MINTKSVTAQLNFIKPGLAIVMFCLLFGVGMGIAFGMFEESFKNAIAQGMAAHPELHDGKSADKIWRFAQRAHFHATGIAAFSLPLLLLVLVSSLKPQFKKISSVLIGMGGLYPLAWFAMYLKAPEIGRDAAHHHIITESLVYVGVGSFVIGIVILTCNLFFNVFAHDEIGE
jgi:hypothetical protein